MSARHVVVSSDITSRAGDFYAFGRMLFRAKNDLPLALRHAETDREVSPRVVEVLRSAVSTGTTTDSSWASSLAPYRTISDGFVAALKSSSAFDAMMPDMVRVPMQTKIAMIVASLAASAVNEGMVKPLAQMALDSVSCPASKAVGMFAISDEVAKFGNTASVLLFNAALRSSVSVATDAAFLTSLVQATTPIASSGTTVAAVIADLQALLTAIGARANSRMFLIVHPDTAVALALSRDAAPNFPDMRIDGGSISGISVLVSDQLPSDGSSPNGRTALMIDATGVLADQGQVVLDSSREALLQLSTTPDSPEGASTVPISLFQRGMVAMKAERIFGFALARPSAAASLSGVNWLP